MRRGGHRSTTSVSRTKSSARNRTTVRAPRVDTHSQVVVNCHPIRSRAHGGQSAAGYGDSKTASCLPPDTILQLRDQWNRRHPSPRDQIRADSPEAVHAALTEKLAPVCKTERCWLQQTHALGDVPDEWKNFFAPMAEFSWRRNRNTWLSSDDLVDVMEQYEDAYPNFRFLGPSPINFDKVRRGAQECVWPEICHLQLSQLVHDGVTDVGFIFNTDPDYKGGEHWISMYLHLPSNRLFFFDSVGDPAPPEIQTLARRIQDQGKQLRPPRHIQFDSNHGFEHQRSTTECGMYSLFFLVNTLESPDPAAAMAAMKTQRVTDAQMEQFRNVLFNFPWDQNGPEYYRVQNPRSRVSSRVRASL